MTDFDIFFLLSFLLSHYGQSNLQLSLGVQQNAKQEKKKKMAANLLTEPIHATLLYNPFLAKQKTKFIQQN